MPLLDLPRVGKSPQPPFHLRVALAVYRKPVLDTSQKRARLSLFRVSVFQTSSKR
jgi:hypothetical protein